MPKALVTGSGGLIGSEAVRFFSERDLEVVGLDNDMRSYFFGAEGSTRGVLKDLQEEYPSFSQIECDIRDEKSVEEIFRKNKFDLIIHTAAQPSHDWAVREPLTDFSVNATGTVVLLENYRKFCSEAVFIFTSTNKVYGDRPNTLPLIELETRWEIECGHRYEKGIDESMSIDACLHSIFGGSKVAADVMVQEYGRYFGLKTGVFRGGCLTGPKHRGVELHGFLSYLVKCVSTGRKYRIFGYKGKQVRDSIHSHDLIAAFYQFYQNPRQGEAYNMGGSRHSHCSVLEAIALAEKISGNRANYEYVDDNRRGDHIWYVSDVSKFQSHYPDWKYTYDLPLTVEEIVREMSDRK